jgi:hypothetical protein
MAEQPKVTPRGDVIRRLRAEQGFETQEEFAVAVGLDVRLIRAAEKGKPSTVKTITAIHDVLVKKKPDLQFDDLIVCQAGFRKEKDAVFVTDADDIHPLITYFMAQPDVEYAIFIKKRTISSVLLEFSINSRGLINDILPAFAKGDFDRFEITAIYLPPETYFYLPVTTIHWLGRRSTLDVSFLDDGTAVITPMLSTSP